MRIAIVQFPGSNCERETMLAVKRARMQPEEFLWNESQEKLADYAGFIIVGGFSYEDRGRAGVIAAQDPIMQMIKQQSKLGKPVLGICNGAQILVETGLVPGLDGDQVGMALTDNKRMQQDQVLNTGYYNAWVHMRLADEYQLNAFTRHLTPKNTLNIPVAHAEGRFIIPPALLKEMHNNGQCVFQYCDPEGSIKNTFPVNPNGSIDNIAAVTNKAGNVMAMMPHPERTTNGDAIFQSMHDYITSGYVDRVMPLHYEARPYKIVKYNAPKATYELIVELVITDNQALSIENALRHSGTPTKIKRYVHWEIACDSAAIFEKIKATGVLYNDRKEIILTQQAIKNSSQSLLLVRAKDDILGQQKLQMLKNHFDISGVHSIVHSILWQTEDGIINSPILFNPYGHDCYDY